MALPADLTAYRDHIAKLNAAVTLDGLRLRCGTPGQALRYRQMCYNVRKIFRDRRMDHAWDDLVIRTEGCEVVITVEATSVLEVMTLDGTPVDIHQPKSTADFVRGLGAEMTRGDVESLEQEALAKGEVFIVPAGVKVIDDTPPSGDDILNSLG